jgi:hypothetical protein
MAALVPHRRLFPARNERRMAHFRCHWDLRNDGRTRSRRVDLPWNCEGKRSPLPLAIVGGPVEARARESVNGFARPGLMRWVRI